MEVVKEASGRPEASFFCVHTPGVNAQRAGPVSVVRGGIRFVSLRWRACQIGGMDDDKTPSRWQAVRLVLGVSALLALLEGAQVRVIAYLLGSSQRSPWWLALFSTSVAWFSMAALVPGVIWLAKRFPLEGAPRPRTVVPLLAGGLLFPLVHLGLVALIEYPVRKGIYPETNPLVMFERLVGTFYVMELTTFVAILGTYMVWSYQRRLRDRELATTQLQLRATALEAGLAEARLSAL